MTIVEACESKTNTTPEFPMGWYSVARSSELLVGAGDTGRILSALGRAFRREGQSGGGVYPLSVPRLALWHGRYV